MDSSTCSRDPRALTRRARRAEFFALVQWLERRTSDAPRIGEYGPAARERVRLRHDPSLGFRASDVSALEEQEGAYSLMTSFLGLTGSVTPLPLGMAEEIALEDPHNAPRRDFLDIIHHRLLSLLYRLVGKFDWPREFLSGAADPWSRRVLAFVGIDPARRRGAVIPPMTWMRLAPLLAAGATTSHALRAALQLVLSEEIDGARVELEQLTGAWAPVDASQQMRLGGHEPCSRLGPDAVLGSNAYLRASRFRIRILGLSDANFRRLLPDGDLTPIIDELTRAFTSGALDHDLELRLARGGTPRFTLRSRAAARLGHDTWLAGQRRVETSIVISRSPA